jgi:hypothetical protein
MEKTNNSKTSQEQIHVSAASLERAQYAKTVIEMKYSKLKQEEVSKKEE